MSDKVIVQKDFGGDGGNVALVLGDGKIKLIVSEPVMKVIEPVTKAIDSAIDKAETAIPGDWDKAILEPLRALIKAEIASFLA